MTAVPSSLPPAALGAWADEHGDDYGLFVRRVAAQQLSDWLPAAGRSILDISWSTTAFSQQMVPAGHRVVRVHHDPDHRVIDLAGPPPRPDLRSWPVRDSSGNLLEVQGDTRDLAWFRDASVDAIVAEGSALSACLATENTARQVARVLRPGGRLIASVDSLLLGLARLAEQNRWPELADTSVADVVLVPRADGQLTRCFGPDELRDLLTDAGLLVEWVRPRTVLPPDVVTRALTENRAGIDDLVDSELKLSAEREGESIGMFLVASARRPLTDD